MTFAYFFESLFSNAVVQQDLWMNGSSLILADKNKASLKPILKHGFKLTISFLDLLSFVGTYWKVLPGTLIYHWTWNVRKLFGWKRLSKKHSVIFYLQVIFVAEVVNKSEDKIFWNRHLRLKSKTSLNFEEV